MPSSAKWRRSAKPPDRALARRHPPPAREARPRPLGAAAAADLAYVYRGRLFGLDLPVRIACVIALVVLGWAFAMNLGRAIGPVLTKRLEPGTAGTIGFLIRLATLVLTVLLSARPFRVGDRVRVHAGGVAGTVEGTVASLGLMREPEGVDLRARLEADIRRSDVERLLLESISVETRSEPEVELEEMEGGRVLFRVRATPANSDDGPDLADQVVAALDKVSNHRHDG